MCFCPYKMLQCFLKFNHKEPSHPWHRKDLWPEKKTDDDICISNYFWQTIYNNLFSLLCTITTSSFFWRRLWIYVKFYFHNTHHRNMEWLLFNTKWSIIHLIISLRWDDDDVCFPHGDTHSWNFIVLTHCNNSFPVNM
jgi:hypothetical protein